MMKNVSFFFPLVLTPREFANVAGLLELDLEYRYWAFVEAHPTHVLLQPKAKQEAYETINWAMTGKRSGTPSPSKLIMVS